MRRQLATGRSRLGLLGRESSFRRVFLATLGSGAGTWLALVALELDVFERTHSSGWIAALLIGDLLRTFAIGLLAGPLIDRLSRRGLMIGADLARFGAFVALGFTTSALQIVALAAVVGIATGVFRPALFAGIPNLVEDGLALAVRAPALLTVLVAWNIAMFASAAINVAEPRLALRTFDAGRFGLGLMMGCAGLGLAVGAYAAGSWIERRGLSNVYGIS